MLIQYKNIKQMRIIVGDDEFEKVWSRGSLSDGKNKLKNYSKENIYAYNKIDDDKILDLLERIYDIDSNLIKKSKTIKDQRSICAHVADDILAADEFLVSKTIDDLSKISATIFHEQIAKINDYFNQNSQLPDLSELETTEVLTLVINKLATAGTFAEAEKIMKIIISNKALLTEINVSSILKKSCEDIGLYNQVLDASYAIEFLSQLLQLTYEKGFPLKMWIEFYNKLINKRKIGFGDIRRSLKQRGAQGIVNPNGMGDELDLEDPPFL